MADRSTLHRAISDLVNGQLLAVLSTHGNGQPYASLVAFAVSEDLGEMYFATERTTRKFSNICENNNVAFLIDNRSNRSEDLRTAAAVTAIGSATEMEGAARENVMKKYLSRHPDLKEFVAAQSTTLLTVKVSRFKLVTHFQEVFELNMDG